MAPIPPSLEQRQALQQRPVEVPVMYQTWQELLFLHWRVSPAVIQERLPEGLFVDTFEGDAWVAIVPFKMRGIRPAWSPVVPYISNFLELNVRTYVYDEQGTPGVWFFSLSANRLLAVTVARTWFRLPYVWANMSARTSDGGFVDYRCRRIGDRHQRVCRYRYRGVGVPRPAEPESLEFFLAERYILFSVLRDGSLATGQVHHEPYSVQPVETEAWDAEVLDLDGLPRPQRPPDHVLYSPGVNVDVFALKW